jgi:hypothetical protein
MLRLFTLLTLAIKLLIAIDYTHVLDGSSIPLNLTYSNGSYNITLVAAENFKLSSLDSIYYYYLNFIAQGPNLYYEDSFPQYVIIINI